MLHTEFLWESPIPFLCALPSQNLLANAHGSISYNSDTLKTTLTSRSSCTEKQNVVVIHPRNGKLLSHQKEWD